MRITDGGLARELPIGLPGLIGWTIVTNAIESRTGESRTRPNRGLIVAILVGVLAIAFEAYGTATAMPAVAGQFHRLDLYDWAFTIFTIAQVFAIVIGGRMADRTGVVSSYALFNLQERGQLFIGPGDEVYEGMVVGENARPDDMDVNPTKEKHLTNVRSATGDELERLIPPLSSSAPALTAELDARDRAKVRTKEKSADANV